MITTALIPAAGRGLRAYPKTSYVSKVMLELAGKPILQRTVELLRDRMGITDIVIIVGYLGDQIRAHFGGGEACGVRIRYLECPNPDMGLARGVLLARELFREPFACILGDEVYLESNHDKLFSALDEPFDAVCGVLPVEDPHRIRQNYSVEVREGRIARLVEKPTAIENNLLGCGTYLFTPRIFDAILRTPPSPRSGRVELTDAINTLARQGAAVRPFYLQGTYFNINSVDDYNYANFVLRAARFPECSISVVVPAYNEEGSIGYVVRDFRDRVDEVFVVDNSSTDRTAAVAAAAGARVETVRLKGYGDTIRYGLDHARGDILVVAEADYSFRARDLGKILEYLKDADMIIGTRTTRELVEQGVNMRGPLRWGNVLVGKLVEALWLSQQPRFTDVGCTYRALWRETWQKIRPHVRAVGPEFSPEMMIEVLRARKRVIEVPVSYHNRLAGESKHSADYWKISRTALRMLRLIAAKRLNRDGGAPGNGPGPAGRR